MIDFIIKAFFATNLFFAGYYLADNYKWQETKKEKLFCILWCIGTIFLGSLFMVFVFAWAIFSQAFKKIDEFFQVHFWFTYYMTKKWDKLEKNQLDSLNRITINIRNKNTIKDKIYRHCTSLINKRNNYVYTEPTDPPF